MSREELVRALAELPGTEREALLNEAAALIRQREVETRNAILDRIDNVLDNYALSEGALLMLESAFYDRLTARGDLDPTRWQG